MRRGSFRKGNISRLGGFLRSTLQDLGVQEKILEQQALAKWKQSVGPQIAASTRPEYIRDGVLFIACKSSMWSSELALHKNDIVGKLNAAVGKPVVKDIRFSARGFRKPVDEVSKDVKATPVDSIPLDEQEAKSAEETAALCESDELASRVKRAIMTSKRLREAKLQDGFRPCVKCGELHNEEHERCDVCRTLP